MLATPTFPGTPARWVPSRDPSVFKRDRYGTMQKSLVMGLCLAAISHTDRLCGEVWGLAGVESHLTAGIASAMSSAGVPKGPSRIEAGFAA